MNIKSVLLFLLLAMVSTVQSQIIQPRSGDPMHQRDTSSFKKNTIVKLDGKTSYKDYKIISIKNDTTIVDTTLNIRKEYHFNYIRKDIFELMPFHNQGQTFTSLGFHFKDRNLAPFMGAGAKHFNYYKVKDIYYYRVPTPTSEAMYRAGLEQGQVLDFLVTMNTSPQLNFSIAYQGLRSLGKYRSNLSSHENIRFTMNYKSKDEKYTAKFHYYLYELMNQENGGITIVSKTFFEKNDKNYKDRGRLRTNFIDASSMLKGRRIFLEHSYLISKPKEKKQIKKKKTKKKKGAKKSQSKKEIVLKKTDSLSLKEKPNLAKDSISKKAKDTVIAQKKSVFWEKYSRFNLKIGHTFLYESKNYEFNQGSVSSYFGDAMKSKINDKSTHNLLKNRLYVSSFIPYIGELKGFVEHMKYSYSLKGFLHINNQIIPQGIKGSHLQVGAGWEAWYNKLRLRGKVGKIVVGDKKGTSLKLSAYYQERGYFNIEGYAQFTNRQPHFNKQLYQSTYKKYNWNNNFKNENIALLGGAFKSIWGAAHLDYTLIDSYTYFNKKSLPEQLKTPVSYLKLKLLNEFRWGNFRLANTVMFQEVTNGKEYFRVPKIVTRNTFYYQNGVFKGDPLLLQIGVTFRYFTAYKMNTFNPLLNEFYLQDDQEIGGYPILDFFVNGRIKNVRLYFKVENFSSSFTGRKYYSAPYHPYRDLTVRFGLVWNWFI